MATYNLYHYVNQFVNNVEVVKNDQVNLSKINNFDKIILSPGPGLPNEHENLFKIIDILKEKSLLGVCLGHQAIAEYFGAKYSVMVNSGSSANLLIVAALTLLSKYDFPWCKFPNSNYYFW